MLKKLMIPVFIILIICLLGSCVTNQVTSEDAANEKKPVTPWLSPIFMYVPGVSQLLHGEYIEAAVVAGMTYGGVALAFAIPAIQGQELPYPEGADIPIGIYAGLGSMAAGVLYNMGDVYATSIGRTRQYRKMEVEYTKDRAAELLRMGDFEGARYLIVDKLREPEDQLAIAYGIASEGPADGVAMILEMTALQDINYVYGPMKSLDPAVRAQGFGNNAKNDIRIFAMDAALQGEPAALETILKKARSFGMYDEVLVLSSCIMAGNGKMDALFELYGLLEEKVPLVYLGEAELFKRDISIEEYDGFDQARWYFKNQKWKEAEAVIDGLLLDAMLEEGDYEIARVEMLRIIGGLSMYYGIKEQLADIDELILSLEEAVALAEGDELAGIRELLEMLVGYTGGRADSEEDENLIRAMAMLSMGESSAAFAAMTIDLSIDEGAVNKLERWIEIKEMVRNEKDVSMVSILMFSDLELSDLDYRKLSEEMWSYDYLFL